MAFEKIYEVVIKEQRDFAEVKEVWEPLAEGLFIIGTGSSLIVELHEIALLGCE